MNSEIERIKKLYLRRSAPAVQRRYAPNRPAQRYMLERRDEETLALLRQAGYFPLTSARVLEVGCGRGTNLLDWVRRGIAAEALHGIDLIESHIETARAVVPGSHLVVGRADSLPYPDETFDIVAQHTVLTSILDSEMRKAIAAEMARVVKQGGTILCFDFRYANPFNVHVRRVAIDELKSYFPGWRAWTASLIVLPPLARILAPLSITLCRRLEAWIPALRSHYVVAFRRAV